MSPTPDLPGQQQMHTKIRLMDSALDRVWLLEPLPPYMFQQFEAGNDGAEFSLSISKLLQDLYSKVNGKDKLSVADRMRCLKNNSWEREHATGTSSLVGFRCQAAENLQHWLTGEGKKCFVLPHLQREENAGFGRRLVTACRLGPRAIYYSVWDVPWMRADGT